MNRSALVGLGAVLLLGLAAFFMWRAGETAAPAVAPEKSPGKTARETKESTPTTQPRSRPAEPRAPVGLSAAEKAARIEKIKRDYDEIRTKTSADYSAAGTKFPGGLNAFLRQLALLEREKRADLAAVLTPQELEDYEMRETVAGQQVDRLLGPTHATVEQRKMVFRLQREFEERFALTYDLTPRALFERETARQQLQEQIRAVLGDELFGSWLYGEGEDYALLIAFSARHNLAHSAPLDLRQIKNEFTVERLKINATPGFSEEQKRAARAVLAQQTELRVLNLIGPTALQAGRNDILSWLPKR